MNHLWDFAIGDKLFCCWPIGELEGGFHVVRDILPDTIRVEGLRLYYFKRRFLKIDEYVRPPSQKEKDEKRLCDTLDFYNKCRQDARNYLQIMTLDEWFKQYPDMDYNESIIGWYKGLSFSNVDLQKCPQLKYLYDKEVNNGFIQRTSS